MTLVLVPRHRSRLAAVSLAYEAGAAAGEPGAALAFAAALAEPQPETPAERALLALETLGAELRIRVGWTRLVLDLAVPGGSAAAALRLLAEVVEAARPRRDVAAEAASRSETGASIRLALARELGWFEVAEWDLPWIERAAPAAEAVAALAARLGPGAGAAVLVGCFDAAAVRELEAPADTEAAAAVPLRTVPDVPRESDTHHRLRVVVAGAEAADHVAATVAAAAAERALHTLRDTRADVYEIRAYAEGRRVIAHVTCRTEALAATTELVRDAIAGLDAATPQARRLAAAQVIARRRVLAQRSEHVAASFLDVAWRGGDPVAEAERDGQGLRAVADGAPVILPESSSWWIGAVNTA
ncbi:MAG: hypothetical protein WEC34_12360 [Acidimicrobiia bacterium]